LDRSWVFPIGIFPKRKIAIIKNKAALTGTDLEVENNVMIAKCCWKARKGCRSISVDYCINRLYMNEEKNACMLSRIGNEVATARVPTSEHMSPSIWQLPVFVLVRLLIFTCIFSLYSDSEQYLSEDTEAKRVKLGPSL
jgi:hypothetical protein